MARWTEINTPVAPLPTSGGSYWSLATDRVHEWAWQDHVFTADECDDIIAIGTRHDLERGVTGDRRRDDYRNSSVRFLHPDHLNDWVFSRVSGFVTMMNDRYFGFDLTGFGEGIQFTRYTAPGEQYRTHTDRGGGGTVRKLSIVVQLSDPEEYGGGDLELVNSDDVTVMSRNRGTMTAFPSWTPHRVTPVTEGTRYSLVAWITGPAFR